MTRLAHDMTSCKLVRGSPAAWLRGPELSCKLASMLRKNLIVAGERCCVKANEKRHTADGISSPACR